MKNYSANQINLESYNSSIELYEKTLEHTDDPALEPNWQWIKEALSRLPSNQNPIFEIGSGTGRDADYIEHLGFRVQRTDAAIRFVERLTARGKDALQFDILLEELPDNLAMIYANAVFPHFRPIELRDIFKKCHRALTPEGVLAFSVKLGNGDLWTEQKLGLPRFFYLWNSEQILTLLCSCGFDVQWTLSEVPGQYDHRWLFVISTPRSLSYKA